MAAEQLNASRNFALLISQWGGFSDDLDSDSLPIPKTGTGKLTLELLRLIDERLIEPLKAIENGNNIDLSVGQQLDLLGKRLNFVRPGYVDRTGQFGFEYRSPIGVSITSGADVVLSDLYVNLKSSRPRERTLNFNTSNVIVIGQSSSPTETTSNDADSAITNALNSAPGLYSETDWIVEFEATTNKITIKNNNIMRNDNFNGIIDIPTGVLASTLKIDEASNPIVKNIPDRTTGASVGFDQGRFSTTNPNAQGRIPIADEPYRRMLKARGILLTTKGTRSDMEKSASALYGDNYVRVESPRKLRETIFVENIDDFVKLTVGNQTPAFTDGLILDASYIKQFLPIPIGTSISIEEG